MRIVIGEDEVLMREGLVLMLEQAGFAVVAIAADAGALAREAEAHLPDLVITDIRMPPTRTDDGLRAALSIRAHHPEVAVLVLSHYVQREYALELVGDSPEGIGYLLKQRIVNVEDFCDAVKRVAAGGIVLDPEVVAKMVRRARRDDSALDRLTPRQREVLAHIAEGRSNAAIARQLSITEKAVVQHTSRIYDHLGLVAGGDDHRRVLAVIRYLSRGPAPP